MNRRRGLLRLALSLAMLWFVYWTFAYVLVPRVSENGPPLAPSLSPATYIALATALILAVPWLVRGFRRN